MVEVCHAPNPHLPFLVTHPNASQPNPAAWPLLALPLPARVSAWSSALGLFRIGYHRAIVLKGISRLLLHIASEVHPHALARNGAWLKLLSRDLGSTYKTHGQQILSLGLSSPSPKRYGRFVLTLAARADSKGKVILVFKRMKLVWERSLYAPSQLMAIQT